VDSQGRPRVAFKSSDYDETGNHALNSLFYLWCNAQCRSVNGEWRAVRVESSPNLRAEWTGSIPAACSEGTWYRLPLSLVLSPTGAPRVAGDVQYVAPCEYNGGMWEPGEQYTYSTVWRAARVVRFDQP
jgi:hypothetical protein